MPAIKKKKNCCYGQAINFSNLMNILQTGSLELKPCLIEVQPYALSELNPHKHFNQYKICFNWDKSHRYQRLQRTFSCDLCSGNLGTKSSYVNALSKFTKYHNIRI